MIHRRAGCLSVALVLLLAASAMATAGEQRALTVLTNLKQNTTTVGYSFEVRVDFNYQDVDPDKIIAIRLTAPYESTNSTINKAINERMAGD